MNEKETLYKVIDLLIEKIDNLKNERIFDAEKNVDKRKKFQIS